MKKIIFRFNGLEKAVEVADVFAVHPDGFWVEDGKIWHEELFEWSGSSRIFQTITEFPAPDFAELEIEVKEVGDE